MSTVSSFSPSKHCFQENSFVGFLSITTHAIRTVPPAPIPKNLTDPVKITAARVKNEEDALIISATLPTSAAVTSWTLLNRDGELLDSDDQVFEDQTPAASLYSALFPVDNTRPLVGRRSWLPSFYRYELIGFEIHTAMRVAVAEWQRDRRPVPLAFYRPEVTGVGDPLCDPYYTLLHSDARKHVSRCDMLTYFVGQSPAVSDEELLTREALAAKATWGLAKAVSWI